jgi:hypothetical protein
MINSKTHTLFRLVLLDMSIFDGMIVFVEADYRVMFIGVISITMCHFAVCFQQLHLWNIVHDDKLDLDLCNFVHILVLEEFLVVNCALHFSNSLILERLSNGPNRTLPS